MARAIVPEAVTPEDLITVCGGEKPPAPKLSEDDFALPQPAENTYGTPDQKEIAALSALP